MDNLNSYGNCSNFIIPETISPQPDNTLDGDNKPMTSECDEEVSDDSDCSYDSNYDDAKWRVSLSKRLPS